MPAGVTAEPPCAWAACSAALAGCAHAQSSSGSTSGAAHSARARRSAITGSEGAPRWCLVQTTRAGGAATRVSRAENEHRASCSFMRAPRCCLDAEGCEDAALDIAPDGELARAPRVLAPSSRAPPFAMAADKPVLGYWAIRGLVRQRCSTRASSRPRADACFPCAPQAQPIRLLLAHAGVDYEDRRYEVTGPTADGCALTRDGCNPDASGASASAARTRRTAHACPPNACPAAKRLEPGRLAEQEAYAGVGLPEPAVLY